MNLLEQGANYLLTAMQGSAGRQIKYRRPSTGQSVTFTAVPGRVPAQVYDERGVLLRTVSNDFIFNRSELGAFTPPNPVRNDEITQTLNGKSEVLIVNGENIGTSHYEDADSYGVAWRVHAKRDRDA